MHHGFGIIQQVLGITPHLVPTIFANDSREPALADATSRDLRRQVTFALLRRAHVGQEQSQNLAAHSMPCENLDRWDAQAFLENLSCRSHRTRKGTAYIRVVSTISHIKGRPGLPGQIHGHDHSQVGQVRSAREWVIEYGYVFWCERQGLS